ncbi:hypothetical protein [Sorangium sp. So ce542]|uniref:hypothetical protein n=1 Tax=Sorangium sp. So ce542 TaxID=3133316 RepID=UPI003F5E959E
MSWRSINLHGAGAIARVCGLYEITDTRVPGARFQIKVIEREPGDYLASLNVCLKSPDGSPNWQVGLGGTEMEALQNALKYFMDELAKKSACAPDEFEWSDSSDF